MSRSSKLRFVSAAQLLEEQASGVLLLDTRAAEQFASVHARGAVQIGLLGPFASWAAILIRPQQKVLLVVEDSGRAQEAQMRLARVGLVRVMGYALADPEQWRSAGIQLATLPTRRSEDILRALRSDVSLQLVDVRSRAEWLKGHLPGAVSLPLLDLQPADSRLMDRSCFLPGKTSSIAEKAFVQPLRPVCCSDKTTAPSAL